MIVYKDIEWNVKDYSNAYDYLYYIRFYYHCT